MRRSIRRSLFHYFVAGTICAALGGVGACRPYDCNDYVTCEPPPPCEPDPAVAPAEDRCGVFVSESLGSDESPGNRAQPVRSMERAIALARVGPMRVYACAEVFLDPMTLPAGVELWGGLDCSKEWSYLGGDRKTVVAPVADMVPLRVEAGSGSSLVADVRVEAADAVAPSASSIAMMVMPGARVEIFRSQLVAGNGAPGADGEDGSSVPAQAGTPGASGGNACSADVVPGGETVIASCASSVSIGGQGGLGDLTVGGEGLEGQPVPVPNPLGSGLGGTGESGAALCTLGANGAEGADGADGSGADGPGRISLLGWEGERGKDGGDGVPGQGGGGGGGTRGGATLCGNGQVRGGAGGGSGGAGGCGGKGGKGGGYGGASVGLVSLGAEVVVRSTTIVSGNGGAGGRGGFRQAGNVGGPGGAGGHAFNLAMPGCNGGLGGKGGDGGYGGGGQGGPSIGIAHLLGHPVTQEDVTTHIGMAGTGGLGGNPVLPGSAGADGVHSDLLTFPQ